ncbi:hypothetical protein F5Y18DRAFT_430090 [Xylariaceae sp. FL1019]|nr:hypothetical protein F5Y18DRAFT_430090 [Xylariaceae sp. FL1019]
MTPVTRYLTELFWNGESFHCGLRFKTIPALDTNEEGKSVNTHRLLLRFPESNAIARKITKGLDTKNKLAVAHALADLYLYAADNVDYCQGMEPVDFFGETKESREWADSLTYDQFWALTRRLLHARALYIATFRNPRLVPAPSNELSAALDTFKQAFDKCYDPNDLPNLGPRPNQEDIERVEDHIFLMNEIRLKYFGLSLANQDGDDTNYKVETIIEDGASATTNPNPYLAELNENEQLPRVPRDMETPVGWYFDLGPRNPRYGHKGVAEQMDEDMDKQEAREAQGSLMDQIDAQNNAAQHENGGTVEDAMDVDMDMEIDMSALRF